MVYVSMLLTSLMPRPHPLMRKGGLVNLVEFLGLVCALGLASFKTFAPAQKIFRYLS